VDRLAVAIEAEMQFRPKYHWLPFAAAALGGSAEVGPGQLAEKKGQSKA
jgi:hypothetical protein